MIYISIYNWYNNFWRSLWGQQKSRNSNSPKENQMWRKCSTSFILQMPWGLNKFSILNWSLITNSVFGDKRHRELMFCMPIAGDAQPSWYTRGFQLGRQSITTHWNYFILFIIIRFKELNSLRNYLTSWKAIIRMKTWKTVFYWSLLRLSSKVLSPKASTTKFSIKWENLVLFDRWWRN